jgi:hypothetical protein
MLSASPSRSNSDCRGPAHPAEPMPRYLHRSDRHVPAQPVRKRDRPEGGGDPSPERAGHTVADCLIPAVGRHYQAAIVAPLCLYIVVREERLSD